MKDFQFWDLSSPINESLSKFFDGVDVFIHIAAYAKFYKSIARLLCCNSVAAKSLFDLCSQMVLASLHILSGSNILKPVDGIVTTQCIIRLS